MKRDSSPHARQAKQALRHDMRVRLRELSEEARAEASLQLCQQAAHLPEFTEAQSVALFVPLPSEPDINPLIEEAWADGKRVALPRMKMGKGKPVLEWFIVADWSELGEPGPIGLREPNAGLCKQVAAGELDCAFIPALAFDEEGFRLGHGGGFYDCFLSEAPQRLACIGLMYACQAVAKVPREAHDAPLPKVLTEEGLRTFR
ncbi:MAG: 5-formyltetrahydrofolate cyclo-ligase [Methylacidiphilales bacterium]|nr:5-formyltetrahydrofolate cyclo-ligase [Candidatus Methylacidiphilales bacterium]